MIHRWFKEWASRHVARHPRSDWPTFRTNPAFWDAFYEHFERHSVTEPEADEASIRLLSEPPRWLGEHPAALYELVRQFRIRTRPPELPGKPRPDPRRDRWDALPEAEREALRAEARRRWPGLARMERRWPSFLVPACLDLMEEASPPADRTTGLLGPSRTTPQHHPERQGLRIHSSPTKG